MKKSNVLIAATLLTVSLAGLNNSVYAEEQYGSLAQPREQIVCENAGMNLPVDAVIYEKGKWQKYDYDDYDEDDEEYHEGYDDYDDYGDYHDDPRYDRGEYDDDRFDD